MYTMNPICYLPFGGKTGGWWGENLLKLKAISKIDNAFINNHSGAGSTWKAKARIAWHSPVRKAAAAASSLGGIRSSIKEKNEEMIIQSDSELSDVSVFQCPTGAGEQYYHLESQSTIHL